MTAKPPAMKKGFKEMTFKEMREQSGMSRQEFAKYFGIPYRTVQSWELGDRSCPEYLLQLIEYKLRKDGIITGKEETLETLETLEKEIEKAERRVALLRAKLMMKSHEEWKKKHPKPPKKTK